MAGIPDGAGTPIIRTDFSDDVAWQAVIGAVEASSEVEGSFSWVEDRRLAGLTTAQVVAQAKGSLNIGPTFGGAANVLAFIADAETMTSPDHPLLCVDLVVSGRSFRIVPEAAWMADANLSLANMDFEEFLDALDGEGVFRGY